MGHHLAPDVIRRTALGARLAAQYGHAPHQRARPDLVEQPRLADTALPGDQPRSAAPLLGVPHDVHQPRDLVAAPNERSGLQEALPRRHGLDRERLPKCGGEGVHRLVRRGEAVLRALREEPREHRPQAVVELVSRPRQGGLQDVRLERAPIAQVEGVLADQQLVGHHPERVQVRGDRDLLPTQHFRRHVCERADPGGSGRLDRLQVRREPEVEHLHLGAHHHDVVGLEIAVQDPMAMKVRQGAERLHDEIDLHRHRATAAGVDDVQRVLFEVHGEERHAVAIEPIVEHADDVRVAERCQQAELPRQLEPRLADAGASPGGRGARPEALQRDHASRRAVERPVDGPHPPTADLVEDPVPATEELGGRRAPLLFTRARCRGGEPTEHAAPGALQLGRHRTDSQTR